MATHLSDANPPVLRRITFHPLESHILHVGPKCIGQTLSFLGAKITLELQHRPSVAPDGDLDLPARVAEFTNLASEVFREGTPIVLRDDTIFPLLLLGFRCARVKPGRHDPRQRHRQSDREPEEQHLTRRGQLWLSTDRIEHGGDHPVNRPSPEVESFLRQL